MNPLLLAGFTPPSAGVCYSPSGAAPTTQAERIAVRPFSALAACNRPIGEGALYASTLDPAYLSLNEADRIVVNTLTTAASYGVCWTTASAADPLVHVTWAEEGSSAGFPYDIRMPIGFTGGPTTGDRQATIADLTTGLTWEIYKLSRKTNTTATASRVERVDLAKRDFPPDSQGTTATDIAQIGMVVRGALVNPITGKPIDHAFGLALGRKPKPTHDFNQIGRFFIPPAQGMDGDALTGNNNLGPIGYGTLFAILPQSKGGPNLDVLFAGEPQMLRYAIGWRDYGGYVVDGGKNPGLRGDQFINEPVRQKLMTASTRFMPHLRRVINSTDLTTATVGGGAPIGAPNCGGGSGAAWHTFP